MKILFLVRPDLLTAFAGDSVQVLKTKAGLEKLGVQVSISRELSPNFEGYDIVHFFNLTRIKETYPQVKAAFGHRIPKVLSTIYWNHEDYLREEKPSLLNNWLTKMPLRREILTMVDMILPNALAEYNLLVKDFDLEVPFRVVPNGVSESFTACRDFMQPLPFSGVKDYVLLVARFCHRKNQLGFLKSLQGVDLPMLFIGPVNDPQYFNICRELAPPHAVFYSYLPPSQLAKAYLGARLHVLPSYFETPGLATLEAAACGCRIVTTEIGTAREYLGEQAYYCNPFNKESIREAVESAYKSEAPLGLPSLVKEKFTWFRAAQETYLAYEELLSRV